VLGITGVVWIPAFAGMTRFNRLLESSLAMRPLNIQILSELIDSKLSIVDVFNLNGPIEIGSYIPGEVISGFEIINDTLAMICMRFGGANIINISNPQLPVVLSRIEGYGFGPGITHSDEIIYVQNDGGRVQIIDITEPASPEQLGFIQLNLVIEGELLVEDNRLFVPAYEGFYILDISDPPRPELIT